MSYKNILKYSCTSLVAALCLITPKITEAADLANNLFGSDMAYIGSQLLVSAYGSEMQGTGGALYVLNSSGGGSYTTETTIGRPSTIPSSWGRYMHLNDDQLVVYDGTNSNSPSYDNNLNLINTANRATSINANGDMFGMHEVGAAMFFTATMANGTTQVTDMNAAGMGFTIDRPLILGINTAAIGNHIFLLGGRGGISSFDISTNGVPNSSSTINHIAGATGGAFFTSNIMTDGTTVVASLGPSLAVIRGSGSNYTFKTVGLPNSPDFTTGTSTRYDDVYVAGNRAAGVDDKGRAFLFQLPSDLASGSIELIGVFDPGNVAVHANIKNSVAIGNGQIAVGTPADTVNSELLSGRVFVFNAP